MLYFIHLPKVSADSKRCYISPIFPKLPLTSTDVIFHSSSQSLRWHREMLYFIHLPQSLHIFYTKCDTRTYFPDVIIYSTIYCQPIRGPDSVRGRFSLFIKVCSPLTWFCSTIQPVIRYLIKQRYYLHFGQHVIPLVVCLLMHLVRLNHWNDHSVLSKTRLTNLTPVKRLYAISC